MQTWEGFPSDSDAATRQLPPAHATTDDGLPFTAVLSVVDHSGIRSSHPFCHPRMLLGRTAENDLMLSDPNISTRHCELAAENGWLVVRDLGSANGTYVNELRISEARLKNGDVVRLGKTQVSVQLRERRQLKMLISGNRKWVLLGVALAGLVLAGVILKVRSAAQHEAELRAKYEQAVKAVAARDLCGRGGESFEGLKMIDEELGQRSIAIEVVGERVKPTKMGRENNVALLGLWRRRHKLYGEAGAEVKARVQLEHDQLEKVQRVGARLASSKDKKIAFWIDGLLAERLAAVDGLLTGLNEAGKRTEKFAELVERFAIDNELQAARELARFDVGAASDDLLKKCESEQARLNSGVLGALNGLDE